MRRAVKAFILGSSLALGGSFLVQLCIVSAEAGSGCVAFAHTQLTDGSSRSVGGVTVTIPSVDVYRGQIVGGTFEASGGGVTSITLFSGHQSQTETFDPPASSGDFFSPFEKGPGNPRGLSEVDFCVASARTTTTTTTTGHGGGGPVGSTDAPEARPANAVTETAPFAG
jgi:hypothetical protein